MPPNVMVTRERERDTVRSGHADAKGKRRNSERSESLARTSSMGDQERRRRRRSATRRENADIRASITSNSAPTSAPGRSRAAEDGGQHEAIERRA